MSREEETRELIKILEEYGIIPPETVEGNQQSEASQPYPYTRLEA